MEDCRSIHQKHFSEVAGGVMHTPHPPPWIRPYSSLTLTSCHTLQPLIYFQMAIFQGQKGRRNRRYCHHKQVIRMNSHYNL